MSLHNRFIRVQNESSGKSSWWMINPDISKYTLNTSMTGGTGPIGQGMANSCSNSLSSSSSLINDGLLVDPHETDMNAGMHDSSDMHMRMHHTQHHHHHHHYNPQQQQQQYHMLQTNSDATPSKPAKNASSKKLSNRRSLGSNSSATSVESDDLQLQQPQQIDLMRSNSNNSVGSQKKASGKANKSKQTASDSKKQNTNQTTTALNIDLKEPHMLSNSSGSAASSGVAVLSPVTQKTPNNTFYANNATNNGIENAPMHHSTVSYQTLHPNQQQQQQLVIDSPVSSACSSTSSSTSPPSFSQLFNANNASNPSILRAALQKPGTSVTPSAPPTPTATPTLLQTSQTSNSSSTNRQPHYYSTSTPNSSYQNQVFNYPTYPATTATSQANSTTAKTASDSLSNPQLAAGPAPPSYSSQIQQFNSTNPNSDPLYASTNASTNPATTSATSTSSPNLKYQAPPQSLYPQNYYAQTSSAPQQSQYASKLQNNQAQTYSSYQNQMYDLGGGYASCSSIASSYFDLGNRSTSSNSSVFNSNQFASLSNSSSANASSGLPQGSSLFDEINFQEFLNNTHSNMTAGSNLLMNQTSGASFGYVAGTSNGMATLSSVVSPVVATNTASAPQAVSCYFN